MYWKANLVAKPKAKPEVTDKNIIVKKTRNIDALWNKEGGNLSSTYGLCM